MSDLPTLPSSWAWSTVGEVGQLQLGRQRSPKWHSGPNMRPYLRVKNIYADRIDLSDVMEMDFPPEHYEKYKLEPGDILLCEGQSPEFVGRPAMYRGELPGVCFTNSLIRFRPHKGIDRTYALYCFLHLMYSGRFQKEARITTNIAHLSASRLSSVEFPVPPPREQERIVKTIEELLPGVAAAEGSARRATTRLRAFDRASLALAQAEGEKVTVNDLLIDIEAGKSFKTPGRQANPDEWGVIKVSAMTWGNFREDENKAVPPDQEVDSRHEIKPGDLLLSRANTSEYVGAAVLVGECRPRLLLSDKSMRLRTKAGVDPQWLRYALGSPNLRSQMSALATGTSDSMRNISQAKVRALEIRLPEAKRQRAQVDQIQELESARHRLAAELHRVERRSMTMRRAVLAAAFSGQLPLQHSSDASAIALLDGGEAENPQPRHRWKKKVST